MKLREKKAKGKRSEAVVEGGAVTLGYTAAYLGREGSPGSGTKPRPTRDRQQATWAILGSAPSPQGDSNSTALRRHMLSLYN